MKEKALCPVCKVLVKRDLITCGEKQPFFVCNKCGRAYELPENTPEGEEYKLVKFSL